MFNYYFKSFNFFKSEVKENFIFYEVLNRIIGYGILIF